MSLLEVRDVTVRFGGLVALDGVSFDVEEGAVTALVGPNGSGKTTCFNVISGLQSVNAGRVRFSGRDLTGARPHRRAGIGRTFQVVELFGSMSARENVLAGGHRSLPGGLLASGLRLPPVRRAERRAAEGAERLLGRFELRMLADRPAATLPLGQQRLVELARAVAGAPRLLLLDEVASGLNPAELGRLAGHVRDLVAEGVTVLLVEHNMRFVTSLATRLVVLHHGRLIFDGDVESGLRDAAVVDAYLGGGRAGV